MTVLAGAVHRTFSSLRIRNFRIYFIAQLISVSGTWMQSVAQAWLVLHLTGSGVDLGIVVGLQFLPMLIFGPVGGLVADRVDKRRLLFVTQSAGALLALVLGALVVSHEVVLWQVYLHGHPARGRQPVRQPGPPDLHDRDGRARRSSQRGQPQLGDHEQLTGDRPSHRGCDHHPLRSGRLLLRQRGLLCCRTDRAGHDARPRPAPDPAGGRARGQIREGFRYVWGTPLLRNTLLAVALIGIFAYNFTVTLALLAKETFHGGAGSYSLLTSCMGAGAVIGGLLVAHRARPTPRLLQVLALAFGALLGAVAVAPSLLVASLLIVAMGAASVGFVATANATLQLNSEPGMRGTGDGPVRDGVPGHDPDRGPPGRAHRPADQPGGRAPRRVAGHSGGRRPAHVAAPGRAAESR